jgi:hypothetical protein
MGTNIQRRIAQVKLFSQENIEPGKESLESGEQGGFVGTGSLSFAFFTRGMAGTE